METNLNPEQNKSPKRSKKPLVIGGIAVAVVLAGLGTAYAKFDMFKSAKTIYLEAEANNLSELSSSFDKATELYQKEVQPYLDNPVHSTVELSDISVDGEIPDPDAQKILALLKETKLAIDSSTDQKKQQEYAKLNLILKGQNFIGLELFRDQNKVAFGVPELYKKYGILDLADSDALKERFGIEDLPKRFLTYDDMLNAVKISKAEFTTVAAEYAKLYINNLSDQQVTLKNDAAFEQDGFKTSAREVTVNFTHDQLKTLATQFADKAAADDKLFDLFYTRYDNLAKLMVESGYPDVKQVPKEEAKTEYKKALDDFKKEIESDSAKGGLKLVMQIDSDDHILSRKFIPVEENGKEAAAITSASWTNNGEKNYLLTFSGADSNGEKGDLKLSYKAKEQGAETKGSFGLTVSSERDSQKDVAVDFNTQFTVTKESGNEKGNYDFTAKIADPSANENVAFSGNVTSNVQKSDKKRDTDTTVKINFDQQVPDMPKGFSFHLKASEEQVNEIKLPALTPDNSLNLAKMSDEEMMQVQQEIGMAAQQFMLKNMMLMQELGIMPQQ